MISRKAKYALKALIVLYKGQGQPCIGIAEIARQEKIPRKFLETILRELKDHGYLISKRGKCGGYSLRKKPQEVSIGQVIRLMDSRVALTPCASRTDFRLCSECQLPRTCAIRALMIDVSNATDHLLDKTTLFDIVDREDKLLYSGVPVQH